jgi:hypothetical protein
MSIKKIAISTALVLVLAVTASAVTLPFPPVVDGIPVAIQYDDFVSYSNQILRTIQNENPSVLPVAIYGEYDFSTGSGGLDVVLYTFNQAQDNIGVGPGDAFTFQAPIQNSNTSTFSGSWGNGDASVNGPVTVGQVLAYLQAFDPANSVPVFYMDLNQTGNEASLNFSGKVELIDEEGVIQHTWAMDTILQPGDGDYDLAARALAAGEIGPLVGTSGTNYGTVNHNLGSGKADFIAFAPTMDLTLFDPNWQFVTYFDMTGLNDGPEEIFMTGGIGVNVPIPEPATIIFLGTGLLWLGVYGRRKMNK